MFHFDFVVYVSDDFGFMASFLPSFPKIYNKNKFTSSSERRLSRSEAFRLLMSYSFSSSDIS